MYKKYNKIGSDFEANFWKKAWAIYSLGYFSKLAHFKNAYTCTCSSKNFSQNHLHVHIIKSGHVLFFQELSFSKACDSIP